MFVAASDIRTLRTYIRGVLGRAKYVDEIVLALAGAVIVWKGSAHL
jgi:hypothetical protein